MSAPEAEVSSAGAPARSRRETRRRLLEAGTRLFAERGLHAATSAAIARAAGVATGTFYLHFPDKQALFREIAFGALDELRDRQERACRGLVPGSPPFLRARTTELLAFADDHGDLIRVVFGRGAESPDIGEQLMDAIAGGLQQAFEARRAEDALAPGLAPAVAAQAVAAMTTRVLGWWVEDPTRASREDVIETLLGLHPSRSAS